MKDATAFRRRPFFTSTEICAHERYTDHMSTRQIASSTLWQVASQVVMAILSIITVKFVAVGLSKELAGNYNSAYGFLQLFGILADFGLYAVAVREMSQAKNRAEVLGALIILRSIILVISLALALALVWFLPAWQGTPLPMGVTIAALIPFFTLLAGILRTVFQVHFRMQYVFIAEVSQRVVSVSIIAFFIMMGVRQSVDVRDYHLFLVAGGIGTFVLFLQSFIFASRFMKVRPYFDRERVWFLFKKAAPYGLAFLFTALYRQLDVTLIAMLRFDYDIQNAYYGFALRATEMAYLIPTFLLNSTLPILSERSAKGEDTRAFVGKIFFAIVLLSTTAFLYAFFWSRPVMELLTTSDYLSSTTHYGSDTALKLLALPMLLNGIVLFAFYNLLTQNVWRPLVTTLALGALLSLGLNVLFIPQHGFLGAASSSIITHLFLAAVLLPQSLKIMPMTIGSTLLKQWAIYTVLLGGGLALARPWLTAEMSTLIALVLSLLFIGFIVHFSGIRKTLTMT